jgi:hypothetical protein
MASEKHRSGRHIELRGLGTAGTRRRFRELVLEASAIPNIHCTSSLIRGTSRLRASTAPATTRGVWLGNPEIVEAGNVQSAKILTGGGARFVLMSAYENSLLSGVLEHPSKGGALLDTGTVLDTRWNSC